MSKKTERVTSPITKELLSAEESKRIRVLRKARGGARRAARSGDPAKRAEAERTLVLIPHHIREIYLKNYELTKEK